MTDNWLALASALLGALVGGGASMFGTIVVGRRELTRSARIRLYDDDLPVLFETTERGRAGGALHYWQTNWHNESFRLQVIRTATMAGRSTLKRAHTVIATMHDYDAIGRTELAEAERASAEERRLWLARREESERSPHVKLPDVSFTQSHEYPRPLTHISEERVIAAVDEFQAWLGKKLR